MIFHTMMIFICFILAIIRPIYPAPVDLVLFNLYGVSGAFVVNLCMWSFSYGFVCMIRDFVIFFKIKKENS